MPGPGMPAFWLRWWTAGRTLCLGAALTALLLSGWMMGAAEAGVVTVDGKTLDATTVNLDGRVLVPLRSIFEALGAEVKYDGTTKEIRATRGSNVVVLTVGSLAVTVDGVPLLIDVPATVLEGRVYVPVRFVGTALGGTVKYYAEQDLVEVKTEAPTPTVIQPTPAEEENLSLAAGNPTQMTAEEFAMALEVIELVNKAREKEGLRPLEYANVALFDAALVRAKELPGSFSHTRPDGSAFNTIFPDIKYEITGENLARYYSSASSVFDGWMQSPGHRGAILDRRFKSIGVAAYRFGGTFYWVQFFIG